jgi:uncharacterized cupin superfamily protein
VRVTRIAEAPTYTPPLHSGVAAVRLQGHEAGPTRKFWVGLSTYHPGGTADKAPTREETVYVVLDGELVATSGGEAATMGPLDSVHFAKGEERSVENQSGQDAHLLVIIAHPEEAPS